MVWGGAGHTKSWDDQAGPTEDTHWYNITDNELYAIDVDESRYCSLPTHWITAIQNPGKTITVTGKQGTGQGSNYILSAFFNRDRQQVLAGLYDCPKRHTHHLYQTCKCCGQYG